MFKFFATDRWYKKASQAEEGCADLTAGSPKIAADSLTGPCPSEEGDSGSTFKVPYTAILNITEHNNAHSLEVCWVYGFQVIAQKGKFKVGDKVIYVPIDSILPQWLEDRLFPADAKIKLNKHRVRQIRIRKLASQGMLISLEEVADYIKTPVLEKDYSHWLGITKYEPPAPQIQGPGGGRNRNKKHEHPLFHKYNGIDNIKWFPDLFKEGETEVVIQEKLHGTNARASLLPFMATTWKKKLLKLFRLAPAIERCYGSNNVQKSVSTNAKHWYENDVWGDTFKAIDVFSKLKLGEIVYGEIVGPGIQNNYDYGLKEHRFVAFDVKVLQPDGKFKWLNPEEVATYCAERGFEHVPVIYTGKYYRNLTESFTKGPSVYSPTQKVREGVCIKQRTEYDFGGNKRALKWVSEDYLDDKTNTDFH
ncbi:MAG: hypothetical protein OIN85_00965 [Candidatus Methanoperedens sp.]|nr:hypothetical protein [Candidatus Methanoperedens sp.]